jgi:hypothetical protein
VNCAARYARHYSYDALLDHSQKSRFRSLGVCISSANIMRPRERNGPGGQQKAGDQLENGIVGRWPDEVVSAVIAGILFDQPMSQHTQCLRRGKARFVPSHSVDHYVARLLLLINEHVLLVRKWLNTFIRSLCRTVIRPAIMIP